MKDEELKRLAEAATAGPWTVRPYLDKKWNERQLSIDANGKAIGTAYKDNAVWLKEGESEANAAYIAAANPATVLLLLERIAKLREALDFKAGADWAVIAEAAISADDAAQSR